MPPGSGVPVPGAKAGSSTSTSTETNTGPRADRRERVGDDGADPAVADVVHEVRVMPWRACQANSSSPGQ